MAYGIPTNDHSQPRFYVADVGKWEHDPLWAILDRLYWDGSENRHAWDWFFDNGERVFFSRNKSKVEEHCQEWNTRWEPHRLRILEVGYKAWRQELDEERFR